MKELKKITKEIIDSSYDNVEGFNHTDLCYKTVFELLNNHGVFVLAFNTLTSLNVESKNQIGLLSFKYTYTKEKDGKFYPMVDMLLRVQNKDASYSANFILSLTPFNAFMENETKDSKVYGGCDKQLTQIWRIMMKGFFGDRWVESFKAYCAEVKNLKESEVATKAELKYQKIEQDYESEITSI